MVITMLFYLVNSSVWATPPSQISTDFSFPDQGISFAELGNVEFTIQTSQPWLSGIAKIVPTVFPYVVPSSSLDNIEIDKSIDLESSDKVRTFHIPLILLDNGEYEVELKIKLLTNGSTISISRFFTVIAENGRVWFGSNSLGSALEAKIRNQMAADTTISTEGFEDTLRQRLKDENRERARIARENSKRISRKLKLAPKAAIVLGEELILKAEWMGKGSGHLGTTAGDSSFPMNGVKITISDKEIDASSNPLSPEIIGYLVNGEFIFTAPRANYSYNVLMQTEFPGIKTDGTVDVGGSGIGSFSVVQEIISGDLYSCEAEDTLVILCDTAHYAGDAEPANSWSVFHGMAEMVMQAKKQLSVEKNSNFKVIFHHDRTLCSSCFWQKNIYVDENHPFEWDVIAHEFGHAIADETGAIDTNTGDSHDGSNQYDFSANSSTFHNKTKSLELAISEGFGTWFGTALLQNPSPNYNGKFRGISDTKYDDASQSSSSDLEGNTARLLSSVPTAYGEDTEVAVLHLLWDLMDSNNESNSRIVCTKCKDTVSLGLNGLWDVLNGSKVSNIIELYEKLLEKTYSTKVSDLLKTGENNINDTGLRGALNMAYTFAEFGVSPYLELPTPKTKLDLIKDKSGPKFKWSQKKTGTLEGLTEFTLALYTFDLKTLVFTETGISANEYTLTESDINDIKLAVDGLSSPPSSLVAVIIGENDYFLELESGPYLSNPIEIMINNVDRTLVVVVDSSGSNKKTDPSNLRIEAAKETLRRLTSLTESQSNNTVPDLAGAVDFDSSITILSSLDDPDNVIPKLNSIDSSGGTDIASGINSAIQILENLNTTGLSGVLKNKAAITVFTDGQNNAGDIPVIQAIVNATLKGIRVHYGFLQPFVFAKSQSFSIPSDAPPGYVVPLQKIQPRAALPATIKEAILASGGVYALIGDADSQVAFVRQIENRGFTNSDNSDPGGQSVVGQTETFDILIDSLSIRSFQFSGSVNEDVRVIVDTNGNFLPFLKIIDRDGNIIAVDNDSDTDGVIKLSFTLPYTGEYHAEVTSQDNNTGQFSLFVDVQNVVLPNQAPNGVIDTPTADIEIIVGQAVSFNATGTDSDNNQPLEYLWTFGSGSDVANSTVEDPGNVTFSKAGVFTVMLVVTDSLGLTDPSAPTITVTVKEPILIPAAPIPTLSEWGVILLAFVMFLVGFQGLRRVNS